MKIGGVNACVRILSILGNKSGRTQDDGIKYMGGSEDNRGAVSCIAIIIERMIRGIRERGEKILRSIEVREENIAMIGG